jgi:hypothetical protein
MQIKSSSSDAVLQFSQVEGEYFEVSLRSSSHSASKRVCCYTDPGGVASLFDDAAAHWRGWPGPKRWESIEGELALELTADRTGHITLNVTISNYLGGPDSWRVQSQLTLEAGQLEALAGDAAKTFRST